MVVAEGVNSVLIDSLVHFVFNFRNVLSRIVKCTGKI